MSLNKLFQSIIELGNRKENKTVSFILAKLLEEAGEFSQACLAKNADINPKKLKHTDQVFEEAADTIICVLDTIGRIYRNDITFKEISEKEIINKIYEQLLKKIEKWKKVEGIK